MISPRKITNPFWLESLARRKHYDDRFKALFKDAEERIENLRLEKLGRSPKPKGERRHERKARNQRDFRRRQRAANPLPVKPRLSADVVSKNEFLRRLRTLREWLALKGHKQRHLRGREADIMRAWIARQQYRREHGAEPTPSAFSLAFTSRHLMVMTAAMAQKRLQLLRSLEALDGPWATIADAAENDTDPNDSYRSNPLFGAF